MSNCKSIESAQRNYDNMMPEDDDCWHDDNLLTTIECPSCQEEVSIYCDGTSGSGYGTCEECECDIKYTKIKEVKNAN